MYITYRYTYIQVHIIIVKGLCDRIAEFLSLLSLSRVMYNIIIVVYIKPA